MKYLKTLLLVVLASTVAAAAYASWNIRQKADGSTVWVNTVDGDEVHVAETHLVAFLENVSSASTTYVVAPIDGNVVSIYSVIFGTVTAADATLIAHKATGVVTGGTWTEITNATAPLTIANGSTAGAVDSVAYTSNYDVDVGDVIAIQTDGGSTNDVDAHIVIIIKPN